MYSSWWSRLFIYFLVIALPAAVVAADSSAAMLYTNGTTWLNGSGVPKSSAIFTGDMVQTKADSLANLNAAGSSVIVHSDSLIQFQGNAIKVEHGGVTVATSKSMATRTGDLTVTPSAQTWTEFEVTEADGKVRVAAHKGDLLIADEAGTTTLPQGQQTTREGSESNKKSKRRAAGAVPGAAGSIMSSPWVIGGGIAAIGGVTTWVLLQGDEPLSPSTPKP